MKTVKTLKPASVVFDILFPESQNFNSKLDATASHCLIRVMYYLREGDMNMGFPSINRDEMELVPVESVG